MCWEMENGARDNCTFHMSESVNLRTYLDQAAFLLDVVSELVFFNGMEAVWLFLEPERTFPMKLLTTSRILVNVKAAMHPSSAF